MQRWLLQAYLFPQKFARKQGAVSQVGVPIYVKYVMRRYLILLPRIVLFFSIYDDGLQKQHGKCGRADDRYGIVQGIMIEDLFPELLILQNGQQFQYI